MLNRSALIAAICLAAGLRRPRRSKRRERSPSQPAPATRPAGSAVCSWGDHWREVWDTPVEVPVLERALRSRRDLLTDTSREYYRFLADDVDVRGTNRAEDFQIRRQASGAIEVSIYAREESTAERASAPFFHRTFLPDETREIRLYTMGGKDHVVVEGAAKGAITLRVISPPGTSKITEDDGVLAPAVYAPLSVPECPLKRCSPGRDPTRSPSSAGDTKRLATGVTIRCSFRSSPMTRTGTSRAGRGPVSGYG